jgi:hypothetical protein
LAYHAKEQNDETLNVHWEWWVALMASIIVHESTHGHLFSRRIPYNVETRSRVERICVAEQQRFAEKLHQSDTTSAGNS